MSDQEKDPVVHSSLSKPLFIWSTLLVLSLAWGLWDEMYGIRPWKGYQARFEKLYSKYLKNAKLRRGGGREADQVVARIPAARRARCRRPRRPRCPRRPAIDKQVNQDLVPKILALNDPFQEVRSHIGALTYQIEVTPQRERQGLAAQGNRGAQERESTRSRCPASPKSAR